MRCRSRTVTFAFLVFVAVGLAGLPVYVFPRQDRLHTADVIFVLGGHGYQRYTYALELAETGYASRVVVSNPAGTQDIWLTDLCSHQRYSFSVQCFMPTPATTAGEARELEHLATINHWHSAIVVTFRPHLSRARYIFQQCFDGKVIMAESPSDISAGYWVWSYLYQTAGFAKAVLEPPC
jgi:uncharacterized SAM-binding protein YcdF (DUF218 family)